MIQVACLSPAIIIFKMAIPNGLYNINVASPNTETLASQLKEWLSAQRHAAYDATTLGEIFGVSNRAINGSMMSLMRHGLIGYDIIDNIKYYYYRED